MTPARSHRLLCSLALITLVSSHIQLPSYAQDATAEEQALIAAPVCSDGLDNDNDGFTDIAQDAGCTDANDDNETNPQCINNQDDDGDGLNDMDDPGCEDITDDVEGNGTSACQDGQDNDEDGVSDMDDPGCGSPQDKDEGDGTTVCQNGQDDDGDGRTDMDDAGCSDRTDGDEFNVYALCEDGIDNDGDGATDMGDRGCDGNSDNDEYNDIFACENGLDDDSDGAVDMGDEGCTDPLDGDEFNQIFACEDGVDNDGDGSVDMGDAGCTDTEDNDEFNEVPKMACEDGMDNDGDGTVDMNDKGCSDPSDSDEYNEIFACENGLDDDGDGAVDMGDEGCENAQDSDEFNVVPACRDGQDNDGDGAADMNDQGCSDTEDTDEFNEEPTMACEDGVDNDGDGSVDMGDAGCTDTEDNDEFNEVPKMACEDGMDNDGDGRTDTEDRGCDGNSDNDEYNDIFACENGLDDDGDGMVDMGDAGCADSRDTDEFNEEPTMACEDGVDNDGDGAADMNDKGCENGEDNDEFNLLAICDDGQDNDGDGAVDMGDEGCENAEDSDEFNALLKCENGEDDDGDGLNDMDDPGCENGNDDDEFNMPACADGNDNDGDGRSDAGADFGCENTQDNDESGEDVVLYLSICANGLDDDNDGRTDMSDKGCDNDDDGDEDGEDPVIYLAVCENGLDDDGDGLKDMDDRGCSAPGDGDESGEIYSCADGENNDGDAETDYPADSDCSSERDDEDDANSNPIIIASSEASSEESSSFSSEFTVPTPKCADGEDNDEDGLYDMEDPGCTDISDEDEFNEAESSSSESASETSSSEAFSSAESSMESSMESSSESSAAVACADGNDNDGDQIADYPNDPGCESATDEDEYNTALCADGVDNDGDGLSDLDDSGCVFAADGDETDAPSLVVDQGALADQLLRELEERMNDDSAGVFGRLFGWIGDVVGSWTAYAQSGEGEAQVGSADVSLSIGATQISRPVVSFTVTVRNDGSVAAQNVQVLNPLPRGIPGVTFNAALSDRRCALVGDIVVCTIGTVRSDAQTSLALTFIVPEDASCTDADLSVRDGAVVTSNTLDFDTANNIAGPVDADLGCIIDPELGSSSSASSDGSASSGSSSSAGNGGPECSDGADNDGDGLTDAADRACHTDFDASNAETYNPQGRHEDDIASQEFVDAHTQDQFCTPLTYTGEQFYSQYVYCQFTVARPWNDTLSTYQQVGFSYVNHSWPGFTGNYSAPGWICDENYYGHGGILCNPAWGAGPLGLGQSANIIIQLHVTGVCGTSHLVGSTVANAYGTIEDLEWLGNSPWVYTNVQIPACPQPVYACSDGVDNDGDGATDSNDFSCSSTTDNDETNPRAACQDGADNDGDGLADFPNDPGCSSQQDNDESNLFQCNDGVDNDGDGAADFGNDFSCSGAFDNDETNPRAACQDGVDNDGDGLTDFPLDPGCSTRQDNNESNLPQCGDGIDNDNDGATDFPNDFSCADATDNDETNPRAACQDGVDNDGDGLTDFPLDPGCSTRQDNNEWNVQSSSSLSSSMSSSSVISSSSVSSSSVTSSSSSSSSVSSSSVSSSSVSSSSSSVSSSSLSSSRSSSSISSICDMQTSSGGFGPCSSSRSSSSVSSSSVSSSSSSSSSARADLSITNSANATVDLGGTLLYAIRVRNDGPNTATNIVVTDPIPAGLVFNASGSDSRCTANTATSTVTCTMPSLTTATNAFFNISYTVPSTLTCNIQLMNQATVSATTFDPDMSDNVSNTVSTRINCPQPLTIAKTDNVTTANEGDALVYVITVGNPANVARTDTIVDTLPAGVTFASATNGGVYNASNRTVAWSNLSFAPGSTTVSVTVTVQYGLTANTTLTNRARLTGAAREATDLTTVNNSTVVCGSEFIYLRDDRDPVPAGETFTYVSILGNNGSSPITRTYTLNLPAEVELISFDSNGERIGDDVRWNNVQIPAASNGAAGDVTLRALVRVKSNTANGSFIRADSHTSGQNCPTSYQITEITNSSTGELTITKTDNYTEVDPEDYDYLTYYITVTNNTSQTVTDTIVDTLPVDVEFRSATDGGTGSSNSQTVTWSNLQFTLGQSRTVSVYVDLKDSARGKTITNKARLSNANREATDTTRVLGDDNTDVCGSEFVYLRDDQDPVDEGDTFTYVLIVGNNSDHAVTRDIELKLDRDIEDIISLGGGYEHDDGREVYWDNVRIDAHDDITYNVTVRVSDDADDHIRSTAHSAIGYDDDECASDFEETQIKDDDKGDDDDDDDHDDDDDDDDDGDFTISKTASRRDDAMVNDVITYTITVRNRSNHRERNVRIEDNYDESLTIESFGGGSHGGHSSIHWNLDFEPHQTKTISYTARIRHKGDHTVFNEACVVNAGPRTCASTSTRIIERLPVTGVMSAFVSNNDDDGRVTPVKRGESPEGTGSAAAAGVVLTTILTGLGAGALGMRRLFL